MIIKNYIGNIVKAFKNEPFNVFENEAKGISTTSSSTFIPLFSSGRAGLNISEDVLINEGYITNDMVYAVATRIAKVTASLPIILTQNKEYIEGSDELKSFIFDNWHDNDSLEQALYKEVLYLILTGDAYHYTPYEYIGARLPMKNYILPTQNVRAWRESLSILSDIDRYEFNDGSKIMKIAPNEIMHTHYFNPSIEGIRKAEGLSPLQAGYDLLKASSNRNIAESSLYENRGASGIISAKNDLILTGADKDIIQKDLNNRIGGAKNANKIVALQGAIDYKQLGMSATDMQLLGMRAEHLRAVCGLFGVQSVIFGDVSASTYNNMQEAMKDFYNQTCIPLMEQILAQKNKQLVKRYNTITGLNYKIEIDSGNISALKTDRNQDIEAVLKLVQAGLITIDEARGELDYQAYTEDEKQSKFATLLSPLVVNNIIATMSEEDKARLINQLKNNL
jgi:HK97 family phage portal protein